VSKTTVEFMNPIKHRDLFWEIFRWRP
jgi:hypothetical protein